MFISLESEYSAMSNRQDFYIKYIDEKPIIYLSNVSKNINKIIFGIKINIIDDKQIDTSVEIPNLDEYIDDILLEAEDTRNEYLKYIESVIGNSTDVLMVDSGFQGMTQHNIQKAYGLKFKGRYFIYKGNPFLDNVKGFYHFEESNLKKNLIFFESIFGSAAETSDSYNASLITSPFLVKSA